jgi:hypothetical protein
VRLEQTKKAVDAVAARLNRAGLNRAGLNRTALQLAALIQSPPAGQPGRALQPALKRAQKACFRAVSGLSPNQSGR